MTPSGLRIAHFLINLEIGGAEIMVLNLCRWQLDHSHSPAVHALFGTGSLAQQFAAAQVPVVRYGKSSRLGMMHQIWNQLRTTTVDVVHMHNVSPTVHAALPAKLAGVKAIIATRHSLVNPPYHTNHEIQFSIAARACRAVVGVSDATSCNLRGAPLANASRIVTIHNGAEPAKSANQHLETQGFTLVHVARLGPPKDQATLLRAVALAVHKIPDLRLWIVGSGPLQSALEALAKDLNIQSNVIFWGAQSNVADYLVPAQAFILSSTTEGLPIAALEAMAAGLPLITTDVGGTPEIVRRFGNGLVVPPANPEQLASAIIAAASDAGRLKTMGEASRKAYLAEFTNDHMNVAYLELYTRGRP